MVVPAKATTVMNIAGNLDSFQQADQTGGILNVIDAAGNAVIPATDGAHTFNNLALVATGNGQAFQQTGNLALNGAVVPPAVIGNPIITASNLTIAQARSNNNYAWNQQPPMSPATETVTTVYDSLGNPHEITTLYYQVNDLGEAGINNPTAAGQSQAVYAWYSFDTTGGVAPFSGAATPPGGGNAQDSNLVGGTGIVEGYGRTTGDAYAGDFLVFNTDGSLASTGGVDLTTGQEVQADLYLPPADNGLDTGTTVLPANSPLPTIGANITQIDMNFGTAGVLGKGERDGLFSDAEGTFQIVNGVNTYVPSDTATVKSQNGYADGTLQSLSFDKTGTIQGVFSNGMTFALGQVVLTSVTNEEGLESVGNGYYSQTASSGPSFTGLAGTDNLGTVAGSSLEGSNVDLTVELSNMIIAQRGYESNARVISVVNSTLQTLTQLGQGS
jgi:flagellar hook protein FlgE